MRFPEPPLEGRFLRRYKRFFTDVELDDGSTLIAHCPNTGSLKGCKVEGAPVWLRDSHDPKRKLRFTWQAIQLGGTWVNVDTNLPNKIAKEAFEEGRIPGFEELASIRTEVKYGEKSRIDLLLEDAAGTLTYVEVKSTTLVEGTTALFPDAVTARGLKHLGELEKMVAQGHRALQFYCIARDDVERFAPAVDIDPAYCEALSRVAAAGVEVRAFTTKLEETSFAIHREIPVDLPAEAAPRKKA